MAAPEYVPVKPMDDVRTYESPPRRPDPWIPRRPGELQGSNPRGASFGDQGPDQGYGLLLARRLADQLHLQPGESLDDVIEGALGVALKRASLFGRAPIIHDFTAAFTIWGFLDAQPDDELVRVRRSAFGEVAPAEHYLEKRRIVTAVRSDGLRQPHAAIAEQHRADWRSLLDTSALG